MALPNIIQQINSKIPLSGGNISGDLVFCNTANTINHQICVNNNSSYLEFYGGIDNNSSILQLHGNEYTANEHHKASVRILTGITNEYPRKELLLKPDGTFTWGGNNVITSAGGNMSGSIIHQATTVIQRKDDTGALWIHGGVAWGDGASLELCGKSRTTNTGGFMIQTNDGATRKNLTGGPNTDLTWDGKLVVCVTKYSSGNNWYRKYADGFIEQGGFVSASASTLADKNFTISLITSFTTTTYSFSNIIVLTAATGNWGAGACALKSKSTSSVVVIGEGVGGASPVTGIWWYACGY